MRQICRKTVVVVIVVVQLNNGCNDEYSLSV